MSDFKRKLIVGVIITFGVFLSITSSWDDSIIIDEVPHIGAGYSYLVKHDMRLNPEHPPLAKDLAAIPLLFVNLKKDVFNTPFWDTAINAQWDFGRFFLFNSGNDPDFIKHLARLPILLFFILSSILVFKWAKKLYGYRGGLIALILFVFSPTIMAHGRLVTTDLAASFGILFASYYLIQHFQKPNNKNLLVAGLAFGVALLCKFSTILLIPYFVTLAIGYGLTSVHNKLLTSWQIFRCTILVFIIGFVLVVFPVYTLHTYGYPIERQHSDTTYLLGTYGNRLFADPVVWASGKPIIRAAAEYGLGLLMVNQRAIGGNTTYFLGDVSKFGWHSYFPIVYFIKEPLAWWGLVLIALILIGFQWRYRPSEWINRCFHFVRNHFDETAMLLWLLVYWSVSIHSILNIGIRHMLTVYPLSIILVSGQIVKLKEYAKAKGKTFAISVHIVVFGLLGWYVVENLKVFPYYLTYFNQAVGGPRNGNNYVVDSNLDWGQDLIRFSHWLNEANIKRIEFDYFGQADPLYYLKDKYIHLRSTKYTGASDFRKRNNSDGWLAVSATFLRGSEGTPEEPNKVNFLWLNSFKPTEIIGNSIFIYRIK